jgi:predicted nucleic acid-binding protein
MKDKLFIDTNVMLDFLGERYPFYDSVARISTLADLGQLTMVVSPISFATVNDLLSKYESPQVAKDKLRKFKILSEVCKLDEHTIEKGLNSSFKDFEDSLQYFSAINSRCNIIITRNGKDFKESLIPVMTAEEYLNSIRNK